MPEFILNQSLKDLYLRAKFGINLVTIKRGEEDKAEVLGVPLPDWTFQAKDSLVIFGTEANIESFANKGKKTE